MTFGLLDLRACRRERILRRAYDELYVPAFTQPDEQESLEQYRSRLFGTQQPPPHPVTHFVVAGTGLERDDSAALAGIVVFESYRESGCGLLTYVATAPSARGQGLGRRLVAQAQATMAQDIDAWHGRRGALAAIFAEVHDPAQVAADDDAIDPAVRLEIMRRLGAARVPIRYVQPELQAGRGRSRQLLLAALPLEGSRPPARLAAGAIRGFLHEFYRASGVAAPEADVDYLSMMADLERAGGEPAVVPIADSPRSVRA